MFERLKSLREKRGQIVTAMRAILEKAETEKRDMSAEEAAQHTKLFNDQDKVRHDIEQVERQIEVERQTATTQAQEEERARKTGKTQAEPTEPSERAMVAFRNLLKTGRVDGVGAQELRNLSAGVNTDGGYLVAPMQFVADLIKFVDDQVFIRGRATKYTLLNSLSLGAPSLDTDPADADWTTELATGSEDSSMKFGRRELTPRPIAKRIKVSKKLVSVGALPVDTIVRTRLGYKVGITHEKAFLTGSGANQPLGLFTADAQGISTARDVSTGNTTTSVQFDGLISAKYKLKGQYWNKASWLFHRDALAQVAKLKDGDGQYLWRMSVRDGEPDTILGRPVDMSEYAPNTFTTGLYVGMLGDMSNYWIVDALDMQIQVLFELYAEANQNGYIVRAETDGMPVLEEAFARVKLA